ncbi:MAG TPA: Holliday junction resolvase RuvX [Chloroflexota bacterium]|nr:Holliday junction resolvase RuvX [Chloroflexota bacterium]
MTALRGRLLGIDPGTRRIGIAMSDELGLLATPIEVIHRRSLERDIERIRVIAAEASIERVIVGWPISLDGHAGAAAKSAEMFASQVSKLLECPVELWDERLSTVEARQYQSSRDRRRGVPIDAYAAAVMLQHYLDAHR